MLLDRLPVSSALMEAKLNDPEVAEAFLEAGAPDGPPAHPALAEWTPEVAMMAHMVDRLGEVVAGLVHLGGNKPPQVLPLPRPLTGLDLARARAEDQRHRDLVDEVRAAQERWLTSCEAGATG